MVPPAPDVTPEYRDRHWAAASSVPFKRNKK